MIITSDIRNTVQKRLDSVKNSLASGAAGSYSDYQHTVGYIAGMQDAVDIAIDVISQRMNIEDEDF